MKPRKNITTNLIMIIGIIMVFASVLMFLITYFRGQNAAEIANGRVEALKKLMPETSVYTSDGASSTSISMVELDGRDYIGIIELPIYKSELPIHAYWDKRLVQESPCVYSGTAYENNLIIGADNKQFNFMEIVSIGDHISITEMNGNRLDYTIKDIDISDSVSNEYLQSLQADLVLFSRNSFSFDYTILLCNRK